MTHTLLNTDVKLLEDAIKSTNISALTTYFNQDTNLADYLSGNSELLVLAIKNNKQGMVRFLIAQGVLFPGELSDGFNTLSIALQNQCDIQTINALIETGTNDQFTRGSGPLETALEHGADLAVIESLCAHGLIKRSPASLPLTYQLADAHLYNIEMRISIIITLAETDGFDINEEGWNTPPITRYLLDKDQPNYLFWIIILGGDLTPIYEDYQVYFNQKARNDWSEAILTKQSRLPISARLRFVNYRDFKKGLKEITNAHNQQLMFNLANNDLIKPRHKVSLAKKLLALGAEIEEIGQNEDQETVLQSYCRYSFDIKNFSFVKFLLAKGADFNANGRNTLPNIVVSGNLPMLKFLVKQGVDVNILTSSGRGVLNAFRSPESIGDLEHRKAMLDTLIKSGLDINSKVVLYNDAPEANTGLIEILALANDAELMKYVLERYSHIECSGDEIIPMLKNIEDTELCIKVIDKNPNFCINSYFITEIKDNTFYYPADSLGIAIDWQRFDVAEVLLQRYPYMRADTEKHSLAFFAFKHHAPLGLVFALIERETDLNRLYWASMKSPSLDHITWTKETALAQFLSLLNNREYDTDDIVRITAFLLGQGADASIPRTVEDRPMGYLDKESTLLIASDTHRNTAVMDLLIDSGGMNPNKPESQMQVTAVQSLIAMPKLSDDDVCFYYDYFEHKTGIDWTVKDLQNTDLLLEASSHCRPGVIRHLVDKGLDINAEGGFDNSPALHKAISNLHYVNKLQRAETVKCLISLGADIEALDSDDLTPLMNAAVYGSLLSAQALLDAGACVDRTNTLGHTALTLSIPGKMHYDSPDNPLDMRADMVQLLLTHGANPNHAPVNGTLALTNAIGYQIDAITSLLLGAGADINARDNSGLTPSMIAMQHATMEMCDQLLSLEDIDLHVTNNDGRGLLFYALQRDDAEEVMALVEYLQGQGVTQGLAQDGSNLFMACASACKDALLSHFIGHGEDVNARDNNGFNAANYVVFSHSNASLEQQIQTLKTLNDMGVNMRTEDDQGRNLLQWSLLIGHFALVPALIELGVSVTHTDQQGIEVTTCLAQHLLSALSQQQLVQSALDAFGPTLQLLTDAGAPMTQCKQFLEQQPENIVTSTFKMLIQDH